MRSLYGPPQRPSWAQHASNTQLSPQCRTQSVLVSRQRRAYQHRPACPLREPTQPRTHGTPAALLNFSKAPGSPPRRPLRRPAYVWAKLASLLLLLPAALSLLRLLCGAVDALQGGSLLGARLIAHHIAGGGGAGDGASAAGHLPSDLGGVGADVSGAATGSASGSELSEALSNENLGTEGMDAVEHLAGLYGDLGSTELDPNTILSLLMAAFGGGGGGGRGVVGDPWVVTQLVDVYVRYLGAWLAAHLGRAFVGMCMWLLPLQRALIVLETSLYYSGPGTAVHLLLLQLPSLVLALRLPWMDSVLLGLDRRQEEIRGRGGGGGGGRGGGGGGGAATANSPSVSASEAHGRAQQAPGQPMAPAPSPSSRSGSRSGPSNSSHSTISINGINTSGGGNSSSGGGSGSSSCSSIMSGSGGSVTFSFAVSDGNGARLGGAGKSGVSASGAQGTAPSGHGAVTEGRGAATEGWPGAASCSPSSSAATLNGSATHASLQEGSAPATWQLTALSTSSAAWDAHTPGLDVIATGADTVVTATEAASAEAAAEAAEAEAAEAAEMAAGSAEAAAAAEAAEAAEMAAEEAESSRLTVQVLRAVGLLGVTVAMVAAPGGMPTSWGPWALDMVLTAAAAVSALTFLAMVWTERGRRMLLDDDGALPLGWLATLLFFRATLEAWNTGDTGNLLRGLTVAAMSQVTIINCHSSIDSGQVTVWWDVLCMAAPVVLGYVLLL